MIFNIKLLIKRVKIPKITFGSFLRAFAYFLSLCGLIFYVRGIFVKFFINPDIGLSEKLKQAKDIPFPAITFCSPLVMKSNFTNLMKFHGHYKKHKQILNISESEQNFLAAKSLVCSSRLYKLVQQATNNRSEFDFVKLIDEGGPSIDETFPYCSVNYVQRDCNFLLRRVLTTYGMCYTFNMQGYKTLFNDVISSDFDSYKSENETEEIWSLDGGYTSPDRNKVPYRCNMAQSFQFVMAVNQTDMDDLCNTLKSSFKVFFHLSNEIPTFQHQADYIRFDREFLVKLSAKTRKSKNELRKYKPERRECYFEDERKLKYFKSYTKAQCNFECLTNFTLRLCGCAHFSYPRTQFEPICGLNKIACYLAAYYDWPEEDEMSNGTAMPCNCFPSCSDIEYVYKEKQVVELNEKASMLIFNLQKNYSQGFVSLNIKFGDFHVSETESYVAYTWENFIADCGGLCGLFMGFSFTAAINLFYRIYYIVQNKKSNMTKVFIKKIENKVPKNLWMEQIDEKDLIRLVKWQNAMQSKFSAKPSS